ncbi:histidine kinase dimerization/phosphoacceptor domain -containing protein [Erythrobacter rubeus]|uniref:histidine kinase n=1 Tax=Erythrobacter rubeus TaxID=2760803 RepID=A0ABR8KU68_9SPHN|nr:histidine kinase dimerization/phosphoacceptor domain -containing protein [Erythrobacter rubeus]MBD2842900.1 tetratricopeptide repeat protein [Erythrobacter rubeus]
MSDAERLRTLDAYLLTAQNFINPENLRKASLDWSERARLKVNAVRVPFILSPFVEDGDELGQWLEDSRRLEDDRSRSRFAYYWAYYRAVKEEVEQTDEQRDALLEESFDAGRRGGVMRIGLFALNFKATLAKQSGDYAEAVRLLNKVIDDSDEPRFTLVRMNALGSLAYLFYEIGDHERAVALFDRALDVSDAHPLTTGQLQLNRALALSAADRLEEAETAVKVAIRHFADHVEAGSTEGAAKPGLYNSRFELARIQYRQGGPQVANALALGREAATELYEADYFTESVHAEAFAWLAESYLEQGRYQDAMEMLRQAEEALGTEIDPDNIKPEDQDRAFLLPYLSTMAGLQRSLGEYEEASKYAAAALDLSEQRFEREQLRAVGNADLVFALQEQEERALNLAQAAQLAEKERQLAAGASQRATIMAALAATLLLAAALVAFAAYRAYRAQMATSAAKDMFFTEMHHRVANNLQTLLSLFRIEARRRSANEDDDGAPESVAAIRLRTMALLHEKLRARQSGTLVGTDVFLTELKDLLENSLGRKNVTLDAEFDEALIEADIAAPLGLLVSELVTNAYKHAFPSTGGTISMRLEADDSRAMVTVVDDGIGFEDTAGRDGIGLSLIDDLAAQIRATIERTNGPGGAGTVWVIRDIPLSHAAIQQEVA